MKYEVIWAQAAIDQLTELWTSAADRGAIAAAADEIDEVLRSHAHTAGESRSDNERIIIVRPLAAFVEVDGDRQQVLVRRLRRL